MKTTIRQVLVVLMLMSGSLFGSAQDTAPPYFPDETWRRVSLSDVGMDEEIVNTGVAVYAAEFADELNSVLIIKDGYLVLERYFNDTDARTTADVYSITKSITSILVGMAIDDGIIPGLDVTLGDALPQYFVGDVYSDKADVTLRDLLMMRSGIGWIEMLQAMEHVRGDQDEALAVLTNPMIDSPGVFWNYSTGSSHLVSAIFQRYVGMSLEDYASNRLFEPIGITDWTWRKDLIGTSFGGSEIYTTPLNLARFGHLVLRDGMWNGVQLVSPDWIELTTTTLSNNTKDYGYHWWLNEIDGMPVFGAQGFGGQIIMGVPALDLVVVVTATPAFGGINDDDNYRLLESAILPAIDRTDG